MSKSFLGPYLQGPLPAANQGKLSKLKVTGRLEQLESPFGNAGHTHS